MLAILILIGIIILVVQSDKKKKQVKRITCDGCKNVISGEFIRITEEHLTQPLDYCSKECKELHIKRDREMFADVEVE